MSGGSARGLESEIKAERRKETEREREIEDIGLSCGVPSGADQ